MDGVFFFLSPCHRTRWIRPHLQHHLSVATHASHVAIPHVSYEDCGSLVKRKGEGPDVCRDLSSKNTKLLVRICCFSPCSSFFSFVHHLHRSSPSSFSVNTILQYLTGLRFPSLQTGGPFRPKDQYRLLLSTDSRGIQFLFQGLNT